MFDLTGRICEYKDVATLPLALVGKAVTFGAGGASIKPLTAERPTALWGAAGRATMDGFDAQIRS